jgi:phosphohistidine phosphatase
MPDSNERKIDYEHHRYEVFPKEIREMPNSQCIRLGFGGSSQQQVASSVLRGFLEMPIYFVQHGLALPEQVDPNRPLSADGRKEVECISAYLRKVGLAVKKVCHSGKTRAKETAQIFAAQIGEGNIYELSGMSPNDNVIEFAAAMKEDDTMYVGHLPHMEKLISYLITGDEDAGVVKFVHGGVVCVEKDSTGFHIEWYLKPSMCKI